MSYSYLSDAAKTWSNDQFNNLHATFSRPITIYKTAQQTVVLTNPENNYLFQQAPFNSVVETVIQSGIANARILYGKKQSEVQFGGAGYAQNQIQLAEGEVRIRLDPTGTALLADAKRISFDGTTFDSITSKRPHGLFSPNFNDFYLKKLN